MRGWKTDIAVLIILQLVLGLVYLGNIPRIYVDEIWDSSLGYSLATTGSLKHPFVYGFGGMDVHFVQSRVVLPIVCAAVFKVAGYSVFASRIGSVFFAVLAVISLYAVMHRWFGQRQAFLISLSTIIHPWFFEASRRARPEIYYIGLGLLFLWLMSVYFDSGSRKAAFFSGVIAALSGLAHPNGLILIFAVTLPLIAWQKGRRLGILIPFAMTGFVITVLPYIIYVLWAVKDPQVNFAEQMQLGLLYIWSVTRKIQRWKGFLKWPLGIGFALIMLLSWIAAWYQSKAQDKVLAAVVLLYILVLPFLTVSSACRYLVVTIPFFCALGVRFVWRIVKCEGFFAEDWYKSRLLIAAALVFIYISTSLSAIGFVFYRLRGADINKVMNRAASAIEPGSRVQGDPIFWVGHEKYRYGPWWMIDEVRINTVVNWMIRNHFDYQIRTAWKLVEFRGINEPPESMPDFDEFLAEDIICRHYGTKVDEFRDPYYGPIEIYKLHWYYNN